jgi:hypothetical protein
MKKDKNSIPEGAIRIHLYPYKNILKPRGSMKKESLGLAIHERLTNIWEHWTDPDYGDNPSEDLLMKRLRKNLLDEVEAAWSKFKNDSLIKGSYEK